MHLTEGAILVFPPGPPRERRKQSVFPPWPGRDYRKELFGYGIHHCLGANLARLEAEVAIGAFSRRFGRADLACPASDLPWLDAGIMRKLTRLPVCLG